MILTIDVGNTNITCGVFDRGVLMSTFRMPTDVNRNFEKDFTENLYPLEISGAMIASVVDNIDDRLYCAVKKVCNIEPLILTHNSEMPISINIQNNSEIGADRIANGVRAWNLYKKASVTVDFGTATTFDVINSKGEFIGGLIAPGIKTQLDSLGRATAKLPNLEIGEINKVIGNNTKDAIMAGVILGTASMVDGMIEKTEKELGERPVLIATGGFSAVITKYINHKFDLISPNLTLEGLFDLYNYAKSDFSLC